MIPRNKTCFVCKKPFVGHPLRMYCGPKCQRVLNRDYQRAYKEAHRVAREVPTYEPFPPHIDREGFGHWLSGFSAGEGTFILRITQQRDRAQPRPNQLACFRISLRDDDIESLRLIMSYWACGTIAFQSNKRSKIPNAKPIARYSVQRVADLMKTVVPHFDHYPLHAKKQNDFAIWKRAVELMAEVQDRPKVGRLIAGGVMPTWTDADREEFASLSQKLKDQRKYID